MKARLVAFLVYLAVSLIALSQTPLLGIVLLLLPVIWAVFMLWLSAETASDFGPISFRKSSVLGYTLRYLWGRSVIARVVLSTLGTIMIVGGLGYISTEAMREKFAKPSLTERAATAAATATDTAKEKAGGWVSTARGWFASEDGN